MFQSITVRNFRCFRNLAIDRVAKVNLIVGKNNVGKTALLEALFLLLGPDNPDLPMRLNVLRGLQWFEAIPEEAWGWLFLNKHTEDAIELSSCLDGNKRHLRISLSEPLAAPLPNVANGKSSRAFGSATTAIGARELVLEYAETGREPVVSRASFVAEGEGLRVKLSRPSVSGLPLGIFLTSAFHFAQENAERFSKLQEINREQEVLERLQVLEPRLRRLVVSAPGPGVSVMQGDLGIGRMVPLPLMGDGIGRLLSYLLAMASARKGTVLIDEIENGLHYSVHRKTWKAIADFADRFDAQVFATTHCDECLQAAREAFAGKGPEAFLVHRLDRVGADIEAVTLTQDMLATAQDTGLEIR
jgi:hypothetical protein